MNAVLWCNVLVCVTIYRNTSTRQTQSGYLACWHFMLWHKYNQSHRVPDTHAPLLHLAPSWQNIYTLLETYLVRRYTHPDLKRTVLRSPHPCHLPSILHITSLALPTGADLRAVSLHGRCRRPEAAGAACPTAGSDKRRQGLCAEQPGESLTAAVIIDSKSSSKP